MLLPGSAELVWCQHGNEMASSASQALVEGHDRSAVGQRKGDVLSVVGLGPAERLSKVPCAFGQIVRSEKANRYRFR